MKLNYFFNSKWWLFTISCANWYWNLIFLTAAENLPLNTAEIQLEYLFLSATLPVSIYFYEHFLIWRSIYRTPFTHLDHLCIATTDCRYLYLAAVFAYPQYYVYTWHSVWSFWLGITIKILSAVFMKTLIKWLFVVVVYSCHNH